MKRRFLFISMLSLLLVLSIASSTAVAALSVNGSANGGTSGTGTHAGGAYGISDTSGNTASGYRFTVVDSFGNPQYYPVDIYANARSNMGHNKFTNKYTKTEYVKFYTNSSFTNSTSTTTDGCYYDTALGLTLPATTEGMPTWGENEWYLNPILKKIDSSLTAEGVTGNGWCIELTATGS